MKETSLIAVAERYNCTLERASLEILTAAGRIERVLPCVIRKQSIPESLVRKARLYRELRGLYGGA